MWGRQVRAATGATKIKQEEPESEFYSATSAHHDAVTFPFEKKCNLMDYPLTSEGMVPGSQGFELSKAEAYGKSGELYCD